jgi:ABC-type branched-subunit amino acid transport system substrate-binding protein
MRHWLQIILVAVVHPTDRSHLPFRNQAELVVPGIPHVCDDSSHLPIGELSPKRGQLETLNDEVLQQLEIVVAPNGLAQYALVQLGLSVNVVTRTPDRSERGASRISPLIDAVLQEEADVAIVYGPEAAPYGQENPEELEIVPVTPEIVPPLVQMFRIVTMGVRQGDETFRDRLNVALANRWEEVQAVFESLGVPVLESLAPLAGEVGSGDVLRIGAVLPVGTGQPAITDAMGNAAWTGALMSEDLLAVAAEGGQLRPDVLIASAPNSAAAERAAHRLAITEGVTAVIGGIGTEQARALSRAAEERNFIFFNLAAADAELRGEECSPNTFHVEASEAMYLDTIIKWFVNSGHLRWFFVYEASEESRELYELAQDSLSRIGQDEGPGESEAAGEGALEAGASEVPANLGAYRDALDSIARAEPDVVLMLLPPEAQEFFLSQYARLGSNIPITEMPLPVMQTREFLARLRQSSPESALVRAALWEATLQDHGAADLNERFASRFGEPLDPSGWAAYSAVGIAFQAALAVREEPEEGQSGTGGSEGDNEPEARASRPDVDRLIEYLESPEAVFDLAKGPGISFRPHDHQLSQPLYVIELDPEAPRGSTSLSEDRHRRTRGPGSRARRHAVRRLWGLRRAAPQAGQWSGGEHLRHEVDTWIAKLEGSRTRYRTRHLLVAALRSLTLALLVLAALELGRFLVATAGTDIGLGPAESLTAASVALMLSLTCMSYRAFSSSVRWYFAMLRACCDSTFIGAARQSPAPGSLRANGIASTCGKRFTGFRALCQPCIKGCRPTCGWIQTLPTNEELVRSILLWPDHLLLLAPMCTGKLGNTLRAHDFV